MYNQQFQNNFAASSFSSTPFQRTQASYQPVGNVQSFYGQQNQQQYGANPSVNAYHTANYRGNQMGHDQALRGDSFTPAQQGYTGNNVNYGSFSYGVRGNQQAFNNANNVSSQFGFNTPFTGIGSTISAGQQNFGTSFGQAQGQSMYGQPQSTESYHLANYRGNQQGHDQGIHEDSFYPAQQQGGQGYETNYNSFRYGVRGNEQGYNNVNNVSSQFGFTSAPFNSFGSQGNFR